MSTRGDDPKTVSQVIVMQRVHEQDLAGYVLGEGGWEHLILPAEYEGNRYHTSIGWSDPRTEEGELLWPAHFGAAELAKLKTTLGSYGTAGQLQQRPSPAEGGILKRWWWRFWAPAGIDLPPVRVRDGDGNQHECSVVQLPELEEQLQSWDMAFKDTKASAYVVGQVWGRKGADRFLLDQSRDKLDMPATLAAVRALTTKWPSARSKLVEDKANGPAVIATLRHEIAGLIPIEPDGTKEARAAAISPQIESGNVYLPHPAVAAWVDELINECAMFPNGQYADQVDTLTQALSRMQAKQASRAKVKEY
jgi:predicted phage terminase large subunit-like protein